MPMKNWAQTYLSMAVKLLTLCLTTHTNISLYRRTILHRPILTLGMISFRSVCRGLENAKPEAKTSFLG